jgi:single-strand DNA-binding protein
MLTLNKVMLCGRLVADPELKTTPSNISVTSFRLAVDRGYSKQGEEKQTDFIDVVCWRQTAEFVTKYFKKGSAAYVGGSIQTRTWKDKEGNNRKTVEVVADEVKFAESKREMGKSDSEPSFSNVPSEDFHEIGDDDELPF